MSRDLYHINSQPPFPEVRCRSQAYQNIPQNKVGESAFAIRQVASRTTNMDLVCLQNTEWIYKSVLSHVPSASRFANGGHYLER